MGNRAGQHSIRVNDQWRICSIWRDGNVFEAELPDYYRGLATVIEIILRDDVLHKDFMVPIGLSGRALAAQLGIPANRVTEIVAGRRAVTAETALKLAARFSTTAEFWLGLQMVYDLEVARHAVAA